MRVRVATRDDLPAIVRWREQRAAWLSSKGSDQWSDSGLTREDFRNRVEQSIDAGESWIAETDEGVPVGTIAVDSKPDPGLWSEREIEESYVVHRMIVDTESAGKRVGETLLVHAEEIARRDGRRHLILDAWTSNKELHAYYRLQGFEYIRTVPNHSTPSATLFKRAVSNAIPDE